MKAFFFALIFTPVFALAQSKYTVRRGDTLLSIADRQLGITDKKDPRRYQFVNRLKSKNPDVAKMETLEPGTVLVLPEITGRLAVKPPPPPAAAKVAAEELGLAPAKPAKPGPLPPQNVAPLHPEDQLPPNPPGPVGPVAPTDAKNPPPPLPPHHEPPAPPPPVATLPPPSAAPPPPPPHEAPPADTPHPPAHAEHAEHHDFIGLQPRYQSLSLSATDEATHETAKMTSKSSIGIDLQYGKILSERWHLLAQLGYTSTEFNAVEGLTGISIDHEKETQTMFALGAAYEITPALHFDAFIMSGQRSFIVPTSTANAYELKNVTIPGAELNLSWDFFQGDSSVVGLSAIAEYVAAAKFDNVESKAAIEPVGALYWKSNRGHDHMNYRVSLTSKQGHQHTNLTEQKETATILGAMFSFPL